MTDYEYHHAGNTEAQQKEALAYLLAQSATGKAATGVLSGLAVTQTGTASGSVVIGAGACVAQSAVLDGASVLVRDTSLPLDVFTANPMGAVPRNDLIVFDAATRSVRAITGTPNAVPTDPTLPTTAVPLARLRHAASATTIPTAKIDDLRVFTGALGYFNSGWIAPAAPAGWSGTTEVLRQGDWVTIHLAMIRTGAPLTTTDQTFLSPLTWQPSRAMIGTAHIYSGGAFSTTRMDVATGVGVRAITIATSGTLNATISYPLT